MRCARRGLVRRSSGGAAFAVLFLVAAPVSAQKAGDGFLFGPPLGTVALRAGVDRATAGSDVFRFVTDELTLTRRDFRGSTFAGDAAVPLRPRVAVMFGSAFSRTRTPSEFRHWIDNNDLPIQQTTTFVRLPITASARFDLTEPGRTIGRLAWIPARYTPYVGAGGGALYYRFEQSGDFIDFATTRVFPDKFRSAGWTATVHALAGLDVSFSPRYALSTEARYEWARSPLSADFSGFEGIDLSGLKLTTGILIRY